MSTDISSELKNWRELNDRAAPILARLEKIQAEQKVIENRVKSVLGDQPDGSFEDQESGVSVIHLTRKGAVDWTKLAQETGITTETMDDFRKKSAKAFTFKVVAEAKTPAKATAAKGASRAAAKAAKAAQAEEIPAPNTENDDQQGGLFDDQLPAAPVITPIIPVASASQVSSPVW